jgi:hypothetical protein
VRDPWRCPTIEITMTDDCRRCSGDQIAVRITFEAIRQEGNNIVVSISVCIRTHVLGIAHLRPCELGEVWHMCTRSSLSDLGSCLMKDMAGKLKLARDSDSQVE